MTALLELDGVEARYGPVQALHGISLEVPEGAVVAVLGANGAGKTTTLRAVSGTVRRNGRISFAGKLLRGGPESVARAGIAHVPEGRGTFTELTVTENLKLGAYTRRERSLRADIDRVSAVVPLDSRSCEPAGRDALGGRAADARGRAGADGAAAADHARRALARARSHDRARDLSHRRRVEREGRPDRARRRAGRADRAPDRVERLRPRGGAGRRRRVERRAHRERVGATELPGY